MVMKVIILMISKWLLRRYLNDLGMTVVTLRYRTPRPKGLHKHITAWEDLQRTIRLVRSQAENMVLIPARLVLWAVRPVGI